MPDLDLDNASYTQLKDALADAIAHENQLLDHLGQREEQVARRDRLIRYFSIPYTYEDPDGNTVQVDPDFVTFDPMTKTVLRGNVELKRTWFRVVRGIDLDENGDVLVIEQSPEAVTTTALEEAEGVGLADAPQTGE